MDPTVTQIREQLDVLAMQRCKVFLLKHTETETRTVDSSRIRDAKYIAFLKARNSDGYQISICSEDNDCRLLMLDDVAVFAIERLRTNGFPPACIVETSPANHQVWLKLSGPADSSVRTSILRFLAFQYDTDKSAVNAFQPGKLAGFTNGKHINSKGLHPFIRLVFSDPFAECDLSRLKELSVSWLQSQQAFCADKLCTNASVNDYRSADRWEGDMHRADLAYAIEAIKGGTELDEVRRQIMSRDLSKKGGVRRQNDYVERTINKAIRYASGRYS